jgi:hypothetical protein
MSLPLQLVFLAEMYHETVSKTARESDSDCTRLGMLGIGSICVALSRVANASVTTAAVPCVFATKHRQCKLIFDHLLKSCQDF